jgi:O-antigen ligase
MFNIAAAGEHQNSGHRNGSSTTKSIAAILVLGVGVFWLAAVSWPSSIRVGGSTLSALLTLATAVTFLITLPGIAKDRFRNRLPNDASVFPVLPAPLGIFGVVATISLLSATSTNGVQNWAVYVSFILAILAIGTLWRGQNITRFMVRLRAIAGIVAILGLASQLAGVTVYQPRPFAITGIVILAITIPGKPENWLVRITPYVCAAAIGLSLSRTATLIALLLLVFVVLRGKRRGRTIRALAVLCGIGAVGLLALRGYAPLRDRFIGGDAAVSLGGVALNTSGRANIWGLLESGLSSNGLFGAGVGSASDVVVSRYPEVAQPHNEYLRFLFDFGWPGLALFVAGYLLLVVRCYRRAVRNEEPIHWSALIALIGIGLIAFTDNPFVYPFVMVPVGVLVGLSLSRPPTGPVFVLGHSPSALESGIPARSGT